MKPLLYAILISPVIAFGSIEVVFDYSLDSGGFFDDPAARASMESAGSWLEARLNDSWASITPTGGDSWSYQFSDPATGGTHIESNPNYPANTLLVFAGARDLGTHAAEASLANPTSVSGSTGFVDQVQGLNSFDEFTPLGGSVAFDTSIDWYFSDDPFATQSGKLSFWQTAIHEMIHLLGFASSVQAYAKYLNDGTFDGPHVQSILGTPAVMIDSNHFFDDLTLNGSPAWNGSTWLLDQMPVMIPGTENGSVPTELDYAVLQDIGIGVNVPEPAHYALAAGGALFLLAFWRRRVNR